MIFPSWKRFFAHLSEGQATDLDLIKSCAEFLEHKLPDDAAVTELTPHDDDLIALAPGVTGRIKTAHHFRFDAKTPIRQLATDQVWALAGAGISASTVIAPKKVFKTDIAISAPTFAQIASVTTAPQLKKLKAPSKDAPALEGKLMIAIPPFLGVAIMDEPSDDAFQVLLTAIAATRNFDTSLLGGHEAGWAPTTLAEGALLCIVQLLRLVVVGTVKGVSIETCATARADEWAILAKGDLKSARRRLHQHWSVATQSMVILDELALIALRLTFGGAANPSQWSDVSEMATDLANDLVRDDGWAPTEMEPPHQHLIGDTTRPLPDSMPFAQPVDLAVETPPDDHPTTDCYTDDLLVAFLERDLDKGSRIIPLLITHLLSRPHAEGESLSRDDLLSISKLLAEGAPAEREQLLGYHYIIDSYDGPACWLHA